MPTRDKGCICHWPSSCGGLGAIRCEDAGGGCGGDACICGCGGERYCDGCESCHQGDADDFESGPMGDSDG